MLTDAHLHLYDLFEASGGAEPASIAGLCCASAWNMEEFLWQESFAQRRLTGSVLLSFGIHPQNPDSEALRFLDELASGKRIDAVGECGYDLYTAEYRAQAESRRQSGMPSLRLPGGTLFLLCCIAGRQCIWFSPIFRCSRGFLQ